MDLTVRLQAEVSNFRAGLSAAEGQSARTGAAVSTMSANISRNIAAVNSLNLTRFNSSLAAGQISLQRIGATAPTALVNTASAANRAGQSLTDLGRIAQDAPFGFVAIQNNLSPLLESFQRLQRETGSAGGALRAMAGSLIGPGGLGFALAVIPAAILLFQNSAAKAKREAEAASKVNVDYAESLGQVSQAHLKGGQSAQKEIVILDTLYAATQNATLSTKERKDAVDELQKLYPAYFKNVKDESILAGEAKSAYDKLSLSILATARARAAQDLIAKNQTKRLEIEQRIEDKTKDQADNANKALKIRAGNEQSLGSQREYQENKAIALIGQSIAAEADKKKLKQDILDLDNKSLKLSEEVVKYMKAGADITGKVGALDDGESKKKVKSLVDILKELNEALVQNENQVGATFDDKNKGKISAYQAAINSMLDNGISPTNSAVEKLKGNIATLFSDDVKRKADTFFSSALPQRLALLDADKLKGEKDKAKASLDQAVKELAPLYDELIKPRAFEQAQKNEFVLGIDGKKTSGEVAIMKDALKDLSTAFDQGTLGFDAFKEKYSDLVGQIQAQELTEALNGLAMGFIESGIGDVANSIGESFANGGSVLDAASNALLGSFGKFLSSFGDLLIQYGAAAVLKGKLDLAALIPGAGILAGAAAIAAGIALKVAAGAIGAFASGGKANAKSGNKPTAFANGGIISGPTLGLMGEYSGARNNPEVVAPLSKLKGMLSDNNGGGVFIPSFTIEGETLRVLLNRADRRLGRV